MNEGTGPGAQTRDGCSVELYRRLPAMGELERFAHLVPPSHSILELGSGAGRLTRELLARGHPVTCVDNSEEMLALLPPGARRVLADIETLDLGVTYDAVLLASCLINTPEPMLRARLLATCRRHVEAGGLLIFERTIRSGSIRCKWAPRARPRSNSSSIAWCAAATRSR